MRRIVTHCLSRRIKFKTGDNARVIAERPSENASDRMRALVIILCSETLSPWVANFAVSFEITSGRPLDTSMRRTPKMENDI